MDKIRNEHIRGRPQVRQSESKVREGRVRGFEHVQRRYSEYIGRKMLNMELPGRRQRERPKRRFMDVLKED